MKDYRIYTRLDPEEPGDQRIIEKINKRNRLLYRNISDYIRHALSVYEEELDTEDLVMKIRRGVRSELREFYGRDSITEPQKQEKDGREDDFPLLSEFDR